MPPPHPFFPSVSTWCCSAQLEPASNAQQVLNKLANKARYCAYSFSTFPPLLNLQHRVDTELCIYAALYGSVGSFLFSCPSPQTGVKRRFILLARHPRAEIGATNPTDLSLLFSCISVFLLRLSRAGRHGPHWGGLRVPV